MSSLLLVVALTIAAEQPGAAASQVADSAGRAAEEPRGYREIENDMRAVFANEARAATRDGRWLWVVEMVALYEEVVAHPNYETSDTLRDYRNRLWSRLTRSKREITRDVEKLAEAAEDQRREVAARAEAAEKDAKKPVRPTAGQLLRSARDEVLAARQLDEKNADNDGTQAGGTQTGGTQVSSGRLLADPSVSLNPASALGNRGGGLTTVAAGEALIELIERTIQPDHWEANGGPGVMVYYAPLMALVVRASSEVHGQVGGIMGGLRAANQ